MKDLVLLYKPEMKPYRIYDIVYDKHGYAHFLIYRKGEWVRKSAKHFTPDFYENGVGGFAISG